jgi:hypothetical protein
VSLLIALLMLIHSWKQVDVQAAWRLILASFLGVPLGLWLLTDAPETLVKGILGILLVLFGLYNLSSLHLPTLRQQGYAYPVGFISGVLGGAYNTNGPPIIVYGVLARWSPDRFRATLQGYFLATGPLILAGHWAAGLWTVEVLRLFIYSLPLVLLAVWLGSKLNRHIPPGRFDRFIYVSMIIIGVFLIV